MKLTFPLFVLSLIGSVMAFQPTHPNVSGRRVSTKLDLDRRQFGFVGASSFLSFFMPLTADAQVFFDPAQYGDQELRVSAVDSLRESVRRAILKNPEIAPSFYQLALLDGISYNAKTQEFGPDGSIIKVVLSSKQTDAYTQNLQKAALALIEAEKNLRRKTAITLADAVAIGGAEAIESIGGPVLPVQLGRADAPIKAPVSKVPYDLLNGKYSNEEVAANFKQAGLTEREMTALLCGLLTLQIVEKSRSVEDWRQGARPKFREPGKLGRMSEFKALTDEDIAQAELDAESELGESDDGWYISDSFGSREQRFGDRLAKDDITEKTFNKYLQVLTENAKKDPEKVKEYGWIATLLLDPNFPGCQTWLAKYSASNLNYLKDLGISFNSLTQLGAVFTGGKYESLLKNKPRKSLNDDDLRLF